MRVKINMDIYFLFTLIVLVIFRKGEYSDTFYIVKGGTLKKNLLIYLENKYKWPMVK